MAHTSRLVPPRKGKRLMIFLVQAIKKLFVTCQAAYDVGGLGRGLQTKTTHSCSKASSSEAQLMHEKKVRLEGHIGGTGGGTRLRRAGWGTLGRGTEVGKGLIYPDRLIPGQAAPQTAYCHQEVM